MELFERTNTMGSDQRQISQELIKKYLNKVLASKCFAGAKSLKRFLEFIVATTLESKEEQIKEYILGTEVFGRNESFDPRIDPIVRVEARRLREKLEIYYSTEGYKDRITIQIPKGGYVPIFSESSSTVSPNTNCSDLDRDERGIAVLPFLNLSSETENESFTDGITEELISALTSIDGLHVIPQTSVLQFKRHGVSVHELGQILRIRMFLEGSVRKIASELRIRVRLIDSISGYNIWSETYDHEMKHVFVTQENACNQIVQALKPKLFALPNSLVNADIRIQPQSDIVGMRRRWA